MKNFALVGAAGYVAPRHMKAIKETCNNLVAVLDPNDSVGIIDSYFPDAHFFTEFERFDRHLEKLRRKNKGKKIDYVSICSPNYLHDAHIRFALRVHAHAICEKPLVLNPWNIDALQEIETETGCQVYNILQLRLHPSLIQLKEKVAKELKKNPDKNYSIDLTYLTSRGRWYFRSWKGDINKSGGIATNIGIHFFDMLMWIFGDIRDVIVHKHQEDTAAGVLILRNAHVRWFLSVNENHLPQEITAQGQRTYRSIKVEDNEIEFSGGFTDLHTQSYRQILDGNGFGLTEARKSIEVVHAIRTQAPKARPSDPHPLYANIK